MGLLAMHMGHKKIHHTYYKDLSYYLIDKLPRNAKMVVETWGDKEVAVGTCEMSPEMFNEAVKMTKENIGAPTNAERASKIKAAFDEKYYGNWLVIVGEGYGLFFAHQAENFAHFFVGKTKSFVIFKVGA